MTEWRTLEIEMNDRKILPTINFNRYYHRTRIYEFPTLASINRIQHLIDATDNRAWVNIKNGTVEYEFPKERN